MKRFSGILLLLGSLHSAAAISRDDLHPDRVFQRGEYVGKEKREKIPVRFKPILEVENHDAYYSFDLLFSLYHSEENRGLSAQGFENSRRKFLFFLYESKTTPVYHSSWFIPLLYFNHSENTLPQEKDAYRYSSKWLILPVLYHSVDEVAEKDTACPVRRDLINLSFVFIRERECSDRSLSFLFYLAYFGGSDQSSTNWLMPLYYYSSSSYPGNTGSHLVLPLLLFSRSDYSSPQLTDNHFLWLFYYSSEDGKPGERFSSRILAPLYWSFEQENAFNMRILMPFYLSVSNRTASQADDFRLILPLYLHNSSSDSRNRTSESYSWLVNTTWYSAKEKEKEHGYFRFYPFYFQSHDDRDNFQSRLILPLYYRSTRDNEKYEDRKLLLLLFWRQSWGRPGERSYYTALLPFFHHSSRENSPEKKANFLPLYYNQFARENGTELSRFYLFPLWYRSTFSFPVLEQVETPVNPPPPKLVKEDRGLTLLYYSFRRSEGEQETKTFKALHPFWYSWWSPEHSRMLILPLYYHDLRTGAASSSSERFIMPFFWLHSRENADERESFYLLPPVFYSGGKYGKYEDSYLNVGLLYNRWSSNAGYRKTVLFPIYWSGRSEDGKSGHLNLVPLFWFDYSPGRRDISLIPVFSFLSDQDEKHSRLKWSAGVILIRSDTTETEQGEYFQRDFLYPLYSYKEDGKEKHFRAFPLVWFNLNKVDSSRVFSLLPFYMDYEDPELSYRLYFLLHGSYAEKNNFRISYWAGPLVVRRQETVRDSDKWDVLFPLFHYRSSLPAAPPAGQTPENPAKTADDQKRDSLFYGIPVLTWWHTWGEEHNRMILPVYFSRKYPDVESPEGNIADRYDFFIPVYYRSQGALSFRHSILFPLHYSSESYQPKDTGGRRLSSTFFMLLSPLFIAESDEEERMSQWYLPWPLVKRKKQIVEDAEGKDFENRLFYMLPSVWWQTEETTQRQMILPLYLTWQDQDEEKRPVFSVRWWTVYFERKDSRREYQSWLFPLFSRSARYQASDLNRKGMQPEQVTYRLMLLGYVHENNDLQGIYYRSVLFPLSGFQRRTDDVSSFSYIFPLFWWFRDGSGHSRILAPFYYSFRDSTSEKTSWLFPLYYRDRHFRDGKTVSTQTYVLGPLFIHDDSGEESSTHLLWPIFTWRSAPKQKSLTLFPLVWHDSGSFDRQIWFFLYWNQPVDIRHQERNARVNGRFRALLPLYFSYSGKSNLKSVLFPLLAKQEKERLIYTPQVGETLWEQATSWRFLWALLKLETAERDNGTFRGEYAENWSPLHYYRGGDEKATRGYENRDHFFHVAYLYWRDGGSMKDIRNGKPISNDFRLQLLVPLAMTYFSRYKGETDSYDSDLSVILPLWVSSVSADRGGNGTADHAFHMLFPFYIYNHGNYHDNQSDRENELRSYLLLYFNQWKNEKNTIEERESGSKYLFPLYLHSWKESRATATGVVTSRQKYGLFYPFIFWENGTRNGEPESSESWYLYPILGHWHEYGSYPSDHWRLFAPLFGWWSENRRDYREKGYYWLWPFGNHTSTENYYGSTDRFMMWLPIIYLKTSRSADADEQKRRQADQWGEAKLTGRSAIVFPVYWHFSDFSPEYDDLVDTFLPLWWYSSGRYRNDEHVNFYSLPFFYFSDAAETSWYFLWPAMNWTSDRNNQYALRVLIRTMNFTRERDGNGEMVTDWNLLYFIFRHEYKEKDAENYNWETKFLILKLAQSYHRETIRTHSVFLFYGYEYDNRPGYYYNSFSLLTLLFDWNHEIEGANDTTSWSLFKGLYRYQVRNGETTHRFLWFIDI